jgi:hypothetical protein
MELGIRPSFVKTSEFRGGGGLKPPNPTSLSMHCIFCPDKRVLHGVCNFVDHNGKKYLLLGEDQS